jgi:low temperature requirement protein LtrA
MPNEPRMWRRPMLARSTTEEHRASTPLELLFDLCFVVAVAQAAARLHHALAEGHPGTAVLGYTQAFFAIWWAWMNFTWFASAYDNDDVPYRLATMVQIAGVLILAAGVPRAFDAGDFALVTAGYVVMRVALIGQWLRAARGDPEGRTCALRYAAGIAILQVGWVARLALPHPWVAVAGVPLALGELAVPPWAERSSSIPWHPGHIAERYGLFTLIVLGESVLAATVAVQSGLDAGEAVGALLALAAGGLLIVFSMWWLYFDQPARRLLGTGRAHSNRVSFLWGYGHLLIFASAAAVGAGLGVAADQATGHAHLGGRGAAAAVAVPVALYLLTVWALHARPHLRGPVQTVAYPVTAALVLVAAAAGGSVLVTGLLLAALVAVTLLSAVSERRQRRVSGRADPP